MSNDEDGYSFTIPPGPAQGAIILVLREALIETLKSASAANGNIPGPWLDDLENTCMSQAKGLACHSMSIEQEAEAVGTAVKFLQDIFDQVRAALDDFNARGT